MKAFRDLKLISSTSEQKRLLNLIEQQISNGWSSRHAQELSSQYRFDIVLLKHYRN